MTPADATLIVLLGSFAIIPLWNIANALKGIERALERLTNLAEKRR